MSKFETAQSVNVNDLKEKKGKFDYLSWPYAVGEMTKLYEDVQWNIDRAPNGLPYFGDKEVGFMVHTIIRADGLVKEQWHPIVDNRNIPIMKPNVFDINTSIQRCLVKNIALFGIGLYIYAGEDLPIMGLVVTEPATITPITEAPPPATKPVEPSQPKIDDVDWDVLGAELTDKLDACTTLVEVTQVNMAFQKKLSKENKTKFTEHFGSFIRGKMAELKAKG